MIESLGEYTIGQVQEIFLDHIRAMIKYQSMFAQTIIFT